LEGARPGIPINPSKDETMDQTLPAPTAEPSPAAAGQSIAEQAIAKMRELVGSRPISPEQRTLMREAAQELRQVLFHLHAYNDLAGQAYLQRITAVGVRRELAELERALVTGRRS
jgi:hypothetical protein